MLKKLLLLQMLSPRVKLCSMNILYTVESMCGICAKDHNGTIKNRLDSFQMGLRTSHRLKKTSELKIAGGRGKRLENGESIVTLPSA